MTDLRFDPADPAAVEFAKEIAAGKLNAKALATTLAKALLEAWKEVERLRKELVPNVLRKHAALAKLAALEDRFLARCYVCKDRIELDEKTEANYNDPSMVAHERCAEKETA